MFYMWQPLSMCHHQVVRDQRQCSVSYVKFWNIVWPCSSILKVHQLVVGAATLSALCCKSAQHPWPWTGHYVSAPCSFPTWKPNIWQQNSVFLCLLQAAAQQEQPWDVGGYKPIGRQHRGAGGLASSMPGLSVCERMYTFVHYRAISSDSVLNITNLLCKCLRIWLRALCKKPTSVQVCSYTHTHKACIHICGQVRSTVYCFTSWKSSCNPVHFYSSFELFILYVWWNTYCIFVCIF